MDWLSNEQKQDGVAISADMAIGDRTLRLGPVNIETVGCGGGEEKLTDADETRAAGKRLSGLQGFVNLGAYFLAWAKDNHGVVPGGKSAGDVLSLGAVSSDGGLRCHLVSETADEICIMWFGWSFLCNDTEIAMQQGAAIPIQDWADRAQYVLDFYANHGITPTLAA